MKLEAIVEGVVIGVCSGTILSLFLWIRNKVERRNQVRYIAAIISRGLEDLFQAEAIGDEQTNTEKACVRRTVYNEMRRELGDALMGRASRLSYDEVKEVCAPFSTLDQDLRGKKVVLDDKACETLWDGLRTVRWLKLDSLRRVKQ